MYSFLYLEPVCCSMSSSNLSQLIQKESLHMSRFVLFFTDYLSFKKTNYLFVFGRAGSTLLHAGFL